MKRRHTSSVDITTRFVNGMQINYGNAGLILGLALALPVIVKRGLGKKISEGVTASRTTAPARARRNLLRLDCRDCGRGYTAPRLRGCPSCRSANVQDVAMEAR